MFSSHFSVEAIAANRHRSSREATAESATNLQTLPLPTDWGGVSCIGRSTSQRVAPVLRSALVMAVAVAALAGCGTEDEVTTAATPTSAPPMTSTSLEAPAEAQSEAASLPEGDDTTISRVIDGDTVVVAGGTSVRLIGIDTPETKDPRKPVQCFGQEASAHAESLIPAGTPIRLVYDVERTDRYDRTLAYVYRASDGLFVNAALVRDGYAQVATYPPNVAHTDTFVELQQQARDAGRGLWSACGESSAPTTTFPPATADDSTAEEGGDCHPAYPDVCIPSPPPDLNCADVPHRNIRVVEHPDPHGLDGNHDGVGCES